MWVRVTRGTLHLGYAYREGSTGDLPDHIAKDLIKYNCAVPIPPKVKAKEEVKEEEPEVRTAVIKQSRKRPIKKKDEV